MGELQHWVAYFGGALAALFAKWCWWVRNGRKQGKSVWTSTCEWFSLDLMSDQISWLATIAVVWAGGYIYLTKIRLGWEWLDQFPIAVPIAFLLGVIMEYTAPNGFKWLLSKLPFGQANQPPGQ